MAPNPIRASIIMPPFNAERTLARAIEPALAEIELRCEALVIDDALTDATVDIAKQIATEDGRVRVLRNTTNRGPAASRNHGRADARGEWIALLDADDWFAPQRIIDISLRILPGQ